MPSPNRIIIASAGSGKTTSIIKDAIGYESGRSALITYTHHNTEELRDRAYETVGHIPPSLTVSTWYSFILRHFVRPYQNDIYPTPIKQVQFVDGRSAKWTKKDDIDKFFFSEPGCIYLDKISQFACEVIEKTCGLLLDRFEAIFNRLYIDEAQDLAGYDLDLVEHLLKSKVQVTLIGDVRQGAYKTNNSGRNRQYAGAKIVNKFDEWCNETDTVMEHLAYSHRCVQAICDYADQFYPNLPPATSLNSRLTGHDGVFAVRRSDIGHYIEAFRPQGLRLDRKTKDVPGTPLNFGEAKGKTFERTIIFPHKALEDVLRAGEVGRLGNAPSTIAKVYVGITRAKQSVAFVIPDTMKPATLKIFTP